MKLEFWRKLSRVWREYVANNLQASFVSNLFCIFVDGHLEDQAFRVVMQLRVQTFKIKLLVIKHGLDVK